MANEPTIEKMDKAIAEFMELETDNERHLAHRRTVYLVNGYWWPLRKLKYRTSWDWLMPVVEKVNNTIIPDNKHPASVIIFKTTCHINDDMSILIETTVTKNGTLIECVFNAIYQFITWYNQQKQKDGAK